MLFSVEEVLEITGGSLFSGSAESRFTGAVIDSREAQAGDLFFPLQGEKENGHRYILPALQQGAAGALLENKEIKNFGGTVFPAGRAVLAVEDALLALQQLASFHRSRFELPLLAVTGSNGKTTTKDFLAAVLARRFHVLKTEGNLNNHIGLPLMLLRLQAGHQAAVLEMGMSGRGEIARLASLCRPSLGMITNIGEAHLEMLGSRENIARAKGELLESMGPGSTLFLNADDPFLRRLGKRFHGEVFTFGFAEDADYCLHRYEPGAGGYTFDVRLPGGKGRERFWSPLPGRHNVYNALAAVAVGVHLEIAADEIRAGLASARASALRMERFYTKSGFWVVNDTYNASPTSVKCLLDYLSEWSGPQRKIAVLGDMLELGETSSEVHRQVGAYAAASGLDYLLTLGELARQMARGAAEAGLAAECIFPCSEHGEVLERLAEILEEGAVVLIKGSRGMKMERIAEALQARYNETA